MRQVYQTEDALVLYDPEVSGLFKKVKGAVKKVVKSKAFKIAAVAAATYYGGPVVAKAAGKFTGRTGGAFKLAKGAAGAAAKRKGKARTRGPGAPQVMYETPARAELAPITYPAPPEWAPPLPARSSAAEAAGAASEPAYAAAGMFGGIPPLALAAGAGVVLLLLMRRGR